MFFLEFYLTGLLCKLMLTEANFQLNCIISSMNGTPILWKSGRIRIRVSKVDLSARAMSVPPKLTTGMSW